LTRPRQDDTKVVQALDGMMGGIAFLVAYDLKLFEVLGRGSQIEIEVERTFGLWSIVCGREP